MGGDSIVNSTNFKNTARRKYIPREPEIKMNHFISAPEVRLIDIDGKQLGIFSKRDALDKATEHELDLVVISPNVTPPVCKIMDYGKFIYQKQKRDKEAKKNQKQIIIKEVKFRPATDIGDYEVKLKNIMRFLADGAKVKITLRFKGRELAHKELGLKMLDRVKDSIVEYAKVEQEPKMEGRQMHMLLSPLPTFIKQKQKKIKTEILNKSNEATVKNKALAALKDEENNK